MTEHRTTINQLEKEFEACRPILLALGDENRQHIILEMLKIEDCGGVRVGTITERTHLSRPAVSHHIRILKDAGILNVRREGTKNYYYFNEKTAVMDQLQLLVSHAKDIMAGLPDRSDGGGSQSCPGNF